MAEIGVIVPVYNVRCYLRKCIESILDQTFQDFEIILVDDGSTDGSERLCDAYAEKYENIRVIHKENEGVWSARNRGLDENTCGMVAHLDADDWIDRHYLEVLYRIMKEKQADLVISCGINVLDGMKNKRKESNWKEGILKAEMISKSEAYRRMFLYENNVSVVSWAKLYRKEVFEDIRYPMIKTCGDSKVIDRIIERSGRIACTSYAGYYYLRRRGSLSHNGMSIEKKAVIENARYLWDFTREHYPEIEDAAKVFYYNSCLQLINLMVLDPMRRYERECRVLRREVLKEGKFIINNKYTKVEEKGAVICLLPGILWYRLAWRSYLRITKKDSGTLL